MQKAKNIISKFIKIDPDQIDHNTPMDKSIIPGSVLLHRMYSALSEEGYEIKDQNGIKTYGDFLKALEKPMHNINIKNVRPQTKKDTIPKFEIGIDIEYIDNLPKAKDYREDEFYKNNFTQKEISYAILQVDPRATLAGRFALKEAIIKADNSYLSTPFNKIEILNDKNGKPVYNKFSLSLSHSSDYAIGVAVKDTRVLNDTPSNRLNEETIRSIVENEIKKELSKNEIKNKDKFYFAIALSLFAIAVSLYQIF